MSKVVSLHLPGTGQLDNPVSLMTPVQSSPPTALAICCHEAGVKICTKYFVYYRAPLFTSPVTKITVYVTGDVNETLFTSLLLFRDTNTQWS